ncbi:hypothetical protein L1987_34246 [Smallanthus sonchifolius]|uniref:Uncharacterized protein n=1 Tax=Smallanthus sonchifolius TaxID=185202 RepID=A0ACB9HT57_9ASTR|nr:hypothetical protein L1987_34246 [Smallanthus sonchifolius]
MGISMGEDDLRGYNCMGDSVDEDRWLEFNNLHVVGSCNGLVCVSPVDAEFVVTNPSTREQMKLPTPPHPPCFMKKKRTLFHVLTLKSNSWKIIGQVKYVFVNGISGILCGGALHWFMSDENKKVIISLDLSTEEFKEIPQPADEEYECDVEDEYKLVFIFFMVCGQLRNLFCNLSSSFSEHQVWVATTSYRFEDQTVWLCGERAATPMSLFKTS